MLGSLHTQLNTKLEQSAEEKRVAAVPTPTSWPKQGVPVTTCHQLSPSVEVPDPVPPEPRVQAGRGRRKGNMKQPDADPAPQEPRVRADRGRPKGSTKQPAAVSAPQEPSLQASRGRP
jgi:hypothetical protein